MIRFGPANVTNHICAENGMLRVHMGNTIVNVAVASVVLEDGVVMAYSAATTYADGSNAMGVGLQHDSNQSHALRYNHYLQLSKPIAWRSANARSADIVLADTAGRLQTKTNLMEELSKVRRVAEKGAGTVTETLLVIDATTGQNGMSQAKQFAEAADVSGVVLTKLDGSAKGGIVVAIHSELGVPVKLVGLGEGINDLVEFDETEFVDALFE